MILKKLKQKKSESSLSEKCLEYEIKPNLLFNKNFY